jgi:serine/threonine protein phosphatase PrpC
MLDVEFIQRTDIGRVRPHNEDYLDCALPRDAAEVRSHGWLMVLADGVGGHEAGEVASRVAVESILAGFRAGSDPQPHTALLSRLVQGANSDVYETAHASGTPTGMATTVVACAIRFASAVVAHVGDSRCYLIRGGHAKQLTEDHTLVAQQMRLGLISEQEAAVSTQRHVLSRSLGNDLFVSVDTKLVELQAGDVILLCSDGLHGSVTPKEIAGIVTSSKDLATAADELIALANQKDGGDNISVQLARMRSVERMGMYRGRPYKLY